MPNTPLENVLYIEDDLALARLLQRRMSRSGFKVELANDAKEGIAKLKDKKFQLILVDYNLPDMNGIEVIKKIHSEYAKIPIIILTAGGDERIAIRALEAGASDYAVKDVNQNYFELLPQIMQAAHVKERLAKEVERKNRELLIAKEKAEEASRAKTEFLATISHEIRTPLNVVTNLSTILSKTALDEHQARLTKSIKINADLLMRLISDLLDITKIEDKKIELEQIPFFIKDVLNEIETMFTEEFIHKDLELCIFDNTNNIKVIGDSVRIQQILMNLISNALKFTDVGFVKIIADAQINNNIANIIIKIIDTGIGVNEENLNRIFDKFTQADASINRRFGGSGLGLSIVRGLINLMNGDIKVTSKEGEGSCFEFSIQLPLAAESNINDQITHCDFTKNCNKKILVIEDYQPNILVAQLMLENLGFNVDFAANYDDAMEAIRNSENNSYCAILMDIHLGEVSGFEISKEIRNWEKDKKFRTPIIAVTANSLGDNISQYHQCGIDDYLAKPIIPKLLEEVLNKHIAGDENG